MRVPPWLLLMWLFVVADSANADKTFRAVSEPFPPFVDPDMEGYGVAWEIARAVLEPQGYRLSLEFMPWSRAIRESEAGTYDALFPAFHSPQREQSYLYTDKIYDTYAGLFKRKDSPIVFDGVTSLQPYSIAVGRGYVLDEAFEQADFIAKVSVSDSAQALRMLYKGRVDLAVGFIPSDHYNLVYKLETDEPGISAALEFLLPPIRIQPLYGAISRNTPNHQTIVKDFNEGLKAIRANGVYNEILRKYQTYLVR